MTKPTEQLPEYYHQWNADNRFDDLKAALAVHNANLDQVRELEGELTYKTNTSDDHDSAIAILDHLKNDLNWGDEVNKKTTKFMKKYGMYEDCAVISHNLEQSIETLQKAKRDHFRLVIKLEEDLKKAQAAKEKSWKAYRELDKKYEAKFDKLKKAEKLAQATEAANVDGFINNEYNEIEDVKKTGKEAA